MTTNASPTKCDYLVVGAGATALAFCDSLLEGCQQSNQALPTIVLLDPHERPGGQWNDSYAFVQLHQPSAMYGVESMLLEPAGDATHRATREEIIAYYENVFVKWQSNLILIGKTRFDFASLGTVAPQNKIYSYQHVETGETKSIQVNRKVVDARFLQPDLPIDTPPKFQYDAEKIRCVAVNALAANSISDSTHYVIIGGGKTGMDAVYYLLKELQVKPENIVWIMPHDAWITARESIGNCMEFLYAALTGASTKFADEQALTSFIQTSPDCLQNAFLQWEQEGKIYRLDPKILPPKFKDATLSKDELATIRAVTQVIRGQGRVRRIVPHGDLEMENGTTITLPWKDEVAQTTYVHCSAGAFNYTKQPTQADPIFGDHVLTLQDVYGTPGFCFVGSILGKLESLTRLSNDEKNALCAVPAPSTMEPPALGPSGGDIGTLSSSHGFVQRLGNVRKWLRVPELRNWLVGHRLFNLGSYPTAEAIETMIEEAWSIAGKSGLVTD